MAWNVRGIWRLDNSDTVIGVGDPVLPGSLLRPDAADSSHSITILLPDGQSILNECFTAKDCARGFRVPELENDPGPFAIQMIERIRAVLVQKRENKQGVSSAAPSPAAHDEAASLLGPDNHVEISGLAASLSDGKYVYDLNPIRAGYPQQSGVPLQKFGRSITLQVPGPGLYSLRIFDSLKNPRIDYVVAAVRFGQGDEIVAGFQKARELFKDWKENFQGWPAHDFLRDYLEALMLDIRASGQSTRIPRARTGPVAGATGEPVFSPRPGVSNGDLEITMRSATPGAVIHYTIDGSQPFDSSPEYHGPIVMKTIPIRIKAFAAGPDGKASPVVTGFFGVANP